jgi:peptidyl-prolyl cis-trans isomerase C
MKAAKGTAALLAPLILLLGCSRSGTPVPTGSRPVAMVNGSPITLEDFALEWNLVRGARGGVAPIGESAARALKVDLLARMIERRLVLTAAAGKIEIPDHEVQQELAEMRAGYNDEQFNETMVAGFLTQDALTKRVRERLVADRYFQRVVFGGLDADRAEEEEYFKAHPGEFGRPEKVRVQHIVVKTEDEILSIRERIKAGEDFQTVCRRASEGPEAKSGCEPRAYARGEMPKVFDAAFALDEGTVSDILPSPYGYHLLKLARKIPAAAPSFEEAEPAVKLKVLEPKKRAAREAWLARARAAAVVKIDQKLLDSIP